ncbi:MAG TPA: hypothetical protein VJL89_14070, partial [Thermodesulfovibrionia bacterium]|nr:hypothetical protein [Thermodesulfovibrionia bacterium]
MKKEEPEIERQIIRPVKLSEHKGRSYWSGFSGQNFFKTIALILAFAALIGGGAWFLHNLSKKTANMTDETLQQPDSTQ